MKCRNCNGDLRFENGILICENCGSSFSTSEFFEDVEVYICYLENDESGRRTKDSAIAQEIYYYLEDKKIRCFYKRVSGDAITGNELQNVSDLVLDSSKIIVLVGTSKDNYLKLWESYSDRLKNKKIIPIYSGMNAYDIPKDINAIQALKYDSVGSLQDLSEGILRALGRSTDTESTYTSRYKQSSKVRLIVIAALLVIVAVVAIGLFVRHNAANKAWEDYSEDENIVEDDQTKYERALGLIDNEKYADAIVILFELGDYNNSQTLLSTCYAQYAGYYYDEAMGLYFRLQMLDNNAGNIELNRTNDEGAKCTISENLVFDDCNATVEYIDSEGNTGTIEIKLENNGINISLTGTENNSEVFIPNTNAIFLISEKSDQPISNDITLDDLKEILTTNTTIQDLQRQGYEISFVYEYFADGEYKNANLYRFDNTDIVLIAFDYDLSAYRLYDSYSENYSDATNMEKLEAPVIYGIEGPASLIAPELIGTYSESYVDGDYLFCPYYSVSTGYDDNYLEFEENIVLSTGEIVWSNLTMGNDLPDDYDVNDQMAASKLPVSESTSVSVCCKDTLGEDLFGRVAVEAMVRNEFKKLDENGTAFVDYISDDGDYYTVDVFFSSDIYEWYTDTFRIYKSDYRIEIVEFD